MAPVHAYAANPRRSYRSAKLDFSSNERDSFEVTSHRNWIGIAVALEITARGLQLSEHGVGVLGGG